MLGAALVFTTIMLVVSEIIGGHLWGAVFYGLVVGGGTVQWWQRRDVDTFVWTFLVLAVGIAAMRWDANVAATPAHATQCPVDQ
jgi:hypothetical protein